ncbi:MAG: hypothetical protein EOO65_00305 [Methanosarcinales archaeon]|nr:MAG: hypothetical protein EOO65_00305 [Methanosarcinales archaeon]
MYKTSVRVCANCAADDARACVCACVFEQEEEAVIEKRVAAALGTWTPPVLPPAMRQELLTERTTVMAEIALLEHKMAAQALAASEGAARSARRAQNSTPRPASS